MFSATAPKEIRASTLRWNGAPSSARPATSRMRSGESSTSKQWRLSAEGASLPASTTLESSAATRVR